MVRQVQQIKYDQCVKLCSSGYKVVREREENCINKVHLLTGKSRKAIVIKNYYYLKSSTGEKVYISKQTAESLCFLHGIRLSKVPVTRSVSNGE